MNALILALIPFLIAHESSWNDSAIGDNGKAYGCLQIWECVIIDVNHIKKTSYTHEDCFDRTKSIEIAVIYLTHYGKHYEKVTGKTVTTEVLARIWNGGPNGWKKSKTDKYWNELRKKIR